MKKNDGIYIAGGQFNNSGNLAVGKRSKVANSTAADQRSATTLEVQVALDQLERIILQSRSSLPPTQAVQVLREIEIVQAQAKQPQPNKTGILDSLKKISDAAGSIGGIVSAVNVVKAAVLAFL